MNDQTTVTANWFNLFQSTNVSKNEAENRISNLTTWGQSTYPGLLWNELTERQKEERAKLDALYLIGNGVYTY